MSKTYFFNLIFPVIYQAFNLLTTVAIKWITMCLRVRQTTPAEDDPRVPRPQAPQAPEIHGPTMV